MSSVLSFLFLGGAGIAIFGASKWSGTLVSHTLAAAAVSQYSMYSYLSLPPSLPPSLPT